jgi:hypothetical protein
MQSVSISATLIAPRMSLGVAAELRYLISTQSARRSAAPQICPGNKPAAQRPFATSARGPTGLLPMSNPCPNVLPASSEKPAGSSHAATSTRPPLSSATPFGQLIGFARRIDPGLEDRDFADAGAHLDRMPDGVFTRYSLTLADVARLRGEFAAWPRP